MKSIPLTAAALAAALLSGCYYSDAPKGKPAPKEEVIFQATIDTGATLTQEPGVGAGAFVEYLGDGEWHVFTTCDTETSGYACAWDVIATAPEGVRIRDVRGGDLEAGDYAFSEFGYDAQLYTETSYGYDHLYFRTASGEGLRFEVYLDGIPDARFIYWVGDGAIHDGAPSNPIDLFPSSE
ncbi:MAG: hypothetical protein KIT72_17140 [Polyangiaceae bacterium]|nr:hypothetical protein [Polyangiaceae bacterium]MCW5792144.1 hypothetical protein [Polyangiaceae bacterium]